eukprot:9233029-Pyramimonas_sp.AAC.1
MVQEACQTVIELSSSWDIFRVAKIFSPDGGSGPAVDTMQQLDQVCHSLATDTDQWTDSQVAGLDALNNAAAAVCRYRSVLSDSWGPTLRDPADASR